MPAEETMQKKRYNAHSFQERMRVIDLYLQGNGCKKIARAMALDDSMVRAWIRKY